MATVTAASIAGMITGFLTECGAAADIDLDGLRSWADLELRNVDPEMFMDEALEAAGVPLPAPYNLTADVRELVTEWLTARDDEIRMAGEPDDEPDTDCHCGHPDCGAC